MNKQSKQALNTLILNTAGMEAYKFVPETDLVDDLGFDSLQLINLVVLIEDLCSVQIPDEYLTMDFLRSYDALSVFISNVMAQDDGI